MVVPLEGSSTIPLYTLTVNAPAESRETDLIIQGRNEDCPLARFLADNCDYAYLCAETQSLHVATTQFAPVLESTWSLLKARYLTP